MKKKLELNIDQINREADLLESQGIHCMETF